MAADGEVERDGGVRTVERRVDIAKAFAQRRDFGRKVVFELAWLAGGIEQDRQIGDLDGHQIGGVLGKIRVSGEHHRDRLADIAHAIRGEDRLAIGIEAFDPRQAEINRRDVDNIARRPHRNHAGRGTGRCRVDRDDAAVCVGGSHHAHVQLMRKTDVGREPAAPGNERPVFDPRHRTSNEAHRAPASFAAINLIGPAPARRGDAFR